MMGSVCAVTVTCDAVGEAVMSAKFESSRRMGFFIVIALMPAPTAVNRMRARVPAMPIPGPGPVSESATNVSSPDALSMKPGKNPPLFKSIPSVTSELLVMASTSRRERQVELERVKVRNVADFDVNKNRVADRCCGR